MKTLSLAQRSPLLRPRIAASPCAAVSAFALAGCAPGLSENGVRNLFDAADRAFLAGDSSTVCDLRTGSFRLESTHFEIARGRTVADRAEADAIEADAVASGVRTAGENEVLDHRRFCMLAYDGRDLARGSRLERGPLSIVFDPAGTSATVRVQYTVLEPEYEARESSHGLRDESLRQVATRRTESEEESVVVRDGGELRIASTRVRSWSYLVPAIRDTRL
jgi:hypothetical protein